VVYERASAETKICGTYPGPFRVRINNLSTLIRQRIHHHRPLSDRLLISVAALPIGITLTIILIAQQKLADKSIMITGRFSETSLQLRRTYGITSVNDICSSPHSCDGAARDGAIMVDGVDSFASSYHLGMRQLSMLERDPAMKQCRRNGEG
jgi:hypothetical protein